MADDPCIAHSFKRLYTFLMCFNAKGDTIVTQYTDAYTTPDAYSQTVVM
jgi:hypothetical protein